MYEICLKMGCIVYCNTFFYNFDVLLGNFIIHSVLRSMERVYLLSSTFRSTICKFLFPLYQMVLL
jgi:hypothetical protein